MSVRICGQVGGGRAAGTSARSGAALWLAAWLLASCLGCAAVYPEVKTRIGPAPPDAELEPPPPEQLLFIAFESVTVPRTTRGGRPWDDVGNPAPDPIGKVFIDNDELFRTPIEADVYQATWPSAPKRNYDVPEGAILRVEVWDANPLHDQPICIKEVKRLHQVARAAGRLDITCEGGARIQMELRPARPKFGLGFNYELRSKGSAITRVLALSPASRAGLSAGDELISVMGRSVAQMSAGELKSAINANLRNGVELTVRTKAGEIRSLTLHEGPIYSLPFD